MSEGRQEGVIIEWDSKRSFGFAQSGDQRVFLYIGNFVKRAKWPERDDRVSFVWGVDPQGRPCAQQIVLLSRGSVLSWAHFVVLGALLVLPFLAIPKLTAWLSPWWIGLCAVVTSALAVLNLWLDKRYAIGARYRVPEATLHLLELTGGWPGSFLAQRFFRHKISKRSYQVFFWLIVLAYELFALDLILGGFLAEGLRSLGSGGGS
jgi:uncharacterized membrane protein YsdA (DUF1294 family)/cold shock CspA family protein